MTSLRARALPTLVPLALVLSCSSPGPAAGDKAFPAGSEKAVRAVRDAVPGAVVGEVTLPKDFGADAEDGTALFWNVEFKSDGKDHTLKVTPDGLIVFLPQPVEEKDLPGAVREAMDKECSGSKALRRERQEARATLRYAALAKPRIGYVAQVSKEGARRRLEILADGTLQRSTDLGGHGEEEEESEEGAQTAANQAPEEAPVPPDAARAVAAVRALLPKMVFRGVEEVGYLDATSQMEVLNYEVEFFLEGAAKEWSATPDGIVIQVSMPVAPESLPPAARGTLEKQVGWKLDKLAQEETRAGLKFVALPAPKVVYLLETEKDGKPKKVRFKPDGTRIEEIDPRTLLGK